MPYTDLTSALGRPQPTEELCRLYHGICCDNAGCPRNRVTVQEVNKRAMVRCPCGELVAIRRDHVMGNWVIGQHYAMSRNEQGLLDECVHVGDQFFDSQIEIPPDEPDIYCTSYCNRGHRMRDGMPVGHNCVILPVHALQAERRGEYSLAIKIIDYQRPLRHSRGVYAGDP